MNIISESEINAYLSFKLGNEVFAVHTENVLHILEMCKVTKVPGTPQYLMGVINLRGSVLPIVDLRIKLGMQQAEKTINTCIIAIEITINKMQVIMGIIVDSVQAVVEFEKTDLLPPPSLGSNYHSEFIVGVTNINDNFIMVLDMDAIFSADQIFVLKDKVEENTVKEITEGQQL